MKSGRYIVLFVVMLLIAIFGTVHHLQATLGESSDSVKSDIEALSAVPRATIVGNGYTIHEMDHDSTIVREYVSPSGLVFAVSWNGLLHPDLTQLLGSYAGEYEQALQETPRGWDRSRLRVKTTRVVVETWGHMRNLQGRAYVPALIPSGVSVNDIK